MKNLQLVIFILLFVPGMFGCVEEPDFSGNNDLGEIYLKGADKAMKTTGSVEIVWKGGGKGNGMGGDMSGEMGNQPENLRAFFEFDAHEATANSGAKGNVLFLVTDQDSTVHREIKATVVNVNIDPTQGKAWFYAQVISDSKGCNGGPGGHETGCSGDDHTDGGCGDDTSHDGGCSHDTTDEGGCTDDHSDGSTCTDGHTDEGGCTDDHSDGSTCTDEHTDEGGCSGSDMGNEGGMDQGSTGGTGMGNPLSGKNCRIGQFILVKVHDLSTPGALEDGLAWKWFAPETTFDLSIEPKKLCKKTIIEGNVFIHI